MRIALIFHLSLATVALPAQAPMQPGETGDMSAGVIHAPASVAVNADYQLRANDVVTITVFQEPDLACTERISADGTIAVPLVGRVRIGGATPVMASNIIRAALEADFLVNAQVSLAVTEVSKQFITILGQVASPGAIALPPSKRVSLLEAVGLAGGFTRLASPSRITVNRTANGTEQVIRVDAEKLVNGRQGETFFVLPGDVITVKERIF